jgi:hypothetical protein
MPFSADAKLMSMNGVAAMVHAAVWLDDVLGMEILSIGRGGLDRKDSCTLEVCGCHLAYSIVIDGGFIFVYAQPMDSAEPLELFFSIGDEAEGWRTVCRFVRAFERSGIRSLKDRPIELGDIGRDGWVIA